MRLKLIAFLMSMMLALVGCGVLRETRPTPQPLQFNASAEQAARAMQEDHFYSDYGRGVLTVSGKVAELRQENGLYVLILETSIATRLECELGSQAPALKPGDAVRVQTPDASQAQRLPGAVRLVSCSLP
jgi:hypothetical protein